MQLSTWSFQCVSIAIHLNLPAIQSVFTLPGGSTLHSRVAGSGLQLMLVHTALICSTGTKPDLQL